MAFNPLKFATEVRAEIGRVTWPTRRDTLVATGQVFALATGAALFFFVIDQLAAFAVRSLFSAN